MAGAMVGTGDKKKSPKKRRNHDLSDSEKSENDELEGSPSKAAERNPGEERLILKAKKQKGKKSKPSAVEGVPLIVRVCPHSWLRTNNLVTRVCLIFNQASLTCLNSREVLL